jgi:aldehyde:ferredoxin oxidoreductase
MEQKYSIAYGPVPVKKGYTDQVLHVNMSENHIETWSLPSDFKDKYIGGRGYALQFIWEKTTRLTRFDSPENLLIMASGPLCGDARFPGSGKFIVGTISPLTDTFVDSNIGGHFAPLLKQSGFDALVISGLSQRDKVLIIDGDQGEIRIEEAPVFHREQDEGSLSYGDGLLRMFGQGELSVHTAAVTAGMGGRHTRFGIINSLYYDPRRGRLRAKQAGRGGTGTVMRTKGLKAVVVRRTMPKVQANDPEDGAGVKKAGAQLKKVVSQMDPKQLRLASWGTPVLVEYMNQLHILPVKNYQYGQDPKAEALFAEVFLEKYLSRKIPDGCYHGCNLACAKGAEKVMLTVGPHAGEEVGIDGPEYETVGAITAMGIFDAQFVMEYNWYCDEYGLDTISTGVTIAFLMECMQRGFLTGEDIGYDLSWGNIESAHRLLHETAKGEGFGAVCGQGVERAKSWIAERYSSRTGEPLEDVLETLGTFAMEVKGLEFSMYITKESLAQQGGYGFALKGPQHDEAWLIFIDQVHKELPTFEMKAQALKWFPLVRTWFNAVGLCKLPWIDVRHPEAAHTDNPAQNQPTLDYYVHYFNATVGSSKSLQDLLDDSERLQLLQKLINLRQGKGTRRSDQIPIRAMGPVFPNEYEARSEYYDSWLKEQTDSELPETLEERLAQLIRTRKMNYRQLCDVVYEEKGYSSDGIPLPETLDRFGLLDDQAKELLSEYNMVLKERLLSN